jgi:hypothetical protein
LGYRRTNSVRACSRIVDRRGARVGESFGLNFATVDVQIALKGGAPVAGGFA